MIYFEFNHGVGAFVRCLLFESAVGASMLGNAGLTSKSKSAKSELQGKFPPPSFLQKLAFCCACIPVLVLCLCRNFVVDILFL
jgi:UPF0716 family protein affecting phage T7 exclusion